MRAAVVCCGNVLLGDDGIGIALADGLSRSLPPDVGLFVAESDSFSIVEVIEGHDMVFIVDAVRAEKFPDGSVLVRPIENTSCGLPLDVHSVGVLDAVQMAEPSVLKNRRVVLVGICVSDLAPRVGLSKPLEVMQADIARESCLAITKYLNTCSL